MAPSIPVGQGLSGRSVQATGVHAENILRTVLAPAVIAGASLTIGYFLGSSTRRPTAVAPEEDEDDPVEEVSDVDLSAITPGLVEPCKMVGRFLSGWRMAPIKYHRFLS